jgi:hypothetical protein
MSTYQPITSGTTFHRLTVIGEAVPRPSHGRRSFRCRCECGKEKTVQAKHLISGHTKSCGCLLFETGGARNGNYKHGYAHNQLYNVYYTMKSRCNNPKNKKFKYYGAVGIQVCQEWSTSYVAFRDWALAHGYQTGLTIERKDFRAGYHPENCCFIPHSEQASNRTITVMLTAFGETKSTTAWSRDARCVVTIKVLYSRIYKYKWDHERAIISPSRRS